jgi:hypothetical protein
MRPAMETAGGRRSPVARAHAGLMCLLVIALACVPVAPVVQGKVTAVTEGGASIAVQVNDQPEAAAMTFDVRTAEIGATPRVGDEVRIVYRDFADVHRALRVMNLTKQRKLEQSGH